MVRTCAYPGCFNLLKPKRYFPQGKDVSFHRLPTHNPERLKLWCLALLLDVNNTPVHSLIVKRVCSDHFLDSDFNPSEQGKRRFLKPSAVPKPFLQQAGVSYACFIIYSMHQLSFLVNVFHNVCTFCPLCITIIPRVTAFMLRRIAVYFDVCICIVKTYFLERLLICNVSETSPVRCQIDV